MTVDDVRHLLSVQIETNHSGSQAAWAAEYGLSPPYVCRVLNGIKKPGPTILAALGLRAVVIYEVADV